jgi:hypothetical protein
MRTLTKITPQGKKILRVIYHEDCILHADGKLTTKEGNPTTLNVANITITKLVGGGYITLNGNYYQLTEKALYYLKGGYF